MDLLQEPVDRAQRQKLLERLKSLTGKPPPKRKQLRLKQGAIQGAVLNVMTEAKKPLSIGQIQQAVEERLKRPVSSHTINSFLSTSAKKHKTTGIYRVERGRYMLVRK